jgi:hypothetical protein
MGFANDVADVLDLVTSFLGTGGEAISSAIDQVAGAREITQSAIDTFDQSLGMCVNEGQLALMNQIGADGFVMAGMDAYENQEDVNLVDLTDHPEAIGEILEEAESNLNDIVQGLLESENSAVEDTDTDDL